MHDLRILTAFVQAVRSGSFSGAARALRCSPGAVSKNIARLEQELGIRLFNRTTRQLCLTDEGRRFYEAVDAGLSALEEADDIVSTSRAEIAGTINVVMGVSVGKFQVLPVIGRFLDRYPQIKLEIAFNDYPPDLVAHGYDVGLRYGAPDDSRYISRRLCALPLVLVASPDYVARHGLPRTLAELARHQCINARLGGMECGWRFVPEHGGGEAVPFMPSGRIVVSDQLEGVLQAVLEGLGPSVVHLHAAARHLASGELVRLLPDYRAESHIEGGSDIYLVYPHRRYLPARVRAFIDYLIAEVGQEKATTPVSPAAPGEPRPAALLFA